MWRDPLHTPRDRITALLSHWPAALIALLLVAAFAGIQFFRSAGSDRIVEGKIVRMEARTGTSLQLRTVVDTASEGQVIVRLPLRTNCRAGSSIQIVARENTIGRSYHAALDACPQH